MDSFSVPKTPLSTTGLSADGKFAFTKAPDQSVCFYLRQPLGVALLSSNCRSDARQIELSPEIDNQTRDSLAVAFRLTESGTTHAAVLCGDQSRVLLINLSTGTLAGQFEVLGARCLAFSEQGNVLYLGAEGGHLFRVAITEDDEDRLTAEVFILESLADSDFDQLQINPSGESHILARLENGSLLGYDASFTWFDYQEGGARLEPDETENYRLHPHDFCGTTGGTDIAVLRRNGELLIFKGNNLFRVKATLPDGETVAHGITASSKFDVIFYGEHEVIGINVERVDEPTDGESPVKITDEILGTYSRPILEVVESPLNGQIVVMCG